MVKSTLRGSAARCTTSSSAPSSVLQGQERPTSCTWSPNFQDFRSGKLTAVCRPQLYDLFGRYVGLGRENWIDGQIVSWCRFGGILYLDEANMMKQDVATRLNPVLDTRGHLVLTEKDNEIIPRHPVGYVIISMNPYSAEFAGTKPLNAAFRRRMSVWIDFDYLSVGSKIAEDEITLVEKKAKVSKEIATGVIRVGVELRRQYKANETTVRSFSGRPRQLGDARIRRCRAGSSRGGDRDRHDLRQRRSSGYS